MNEVVRGVFAAVMAGKKQPEACPDYVVTFYDRLSKRWNEFLSNAEPPHTERAWIAMVAECLHERDVRLIDLENRVRELEAEKISAGSSDVPIDESIDDEPGRVDRRTKAYRAMKLQEAGA